MAKKIKKLTIDLKRWKRGSVGDSALLTTSGQMCCLGFLARECGVSRNDILSKGSIEDLTRKQQLLFPKRAIPAKSNSTFSSKSHRDVPWTEKAIAINDDVDPKDRKLKLTEHFKKIGIKLTFK